MKRYNQEQNSAQCWPKFELKINPLPANQQSGNFMWNDERLKKIRNLRNEKKTLLGVFDRKLLTPTGDKVHSIDMAQ